MRQSLLLIFLLFSVGIKAQYSPIVKTDSTSWTIKHELIDYAKIESLYLTGTITLNGKIYYPTYYNDHNGGPASLVGYFREDSSIGKAWFLGIKDISEYLLMDLNLKIGDSILVKMYGKNKYAHVTGIGKENNRKVIMTDFHIGGGFISENLKFIEGVGPNATLLYQLETATASKINMQGGFLVGKAYNDKDLVYAWDPINFSLAQDWAPIGAKWTYDHDYGLPPYLTTIESVKDTMVLNKLCRLLVTKQTDEKIRSDRSYFWSTRIISKDIIYTSHDTVFHYNRFDNLFYPLYVLNVQKNDKVLVRDKVVPCTKNEYFCSRFEYMVDSISSMSLQGRSLKLIYNSFTQTSDWGFNRSWNLENYPILEKIGSLKYFFGVSKNLVMEGGIQCLRCYNDGQISYKAAYWSKECDYLRPLNGPSSVIDNLDNKIVVSPNPFDSYFRINIGLPIEYELYDSFGKLLMQGEEKEVNTTSLAKGIYLLRLTIDNKEVKTIKLVK